MADDLQTRLDAVAEHERIVQSGPLTRLMRRLGRTSQFAAVYRRVGPVIDPRIAHINDGKLMAKLYGFPVLILHTTGAKSGLPRSSPLLYVRDGDEVMLLGTNFGQPKHPAWTANLLAHPDALVEIGAVRLPVRAQQVDQAAFDAVFPRFVEVYPGYAEYLGRREGLAPRMFRLTPTA